MLLCELSLVEARELKRLQGDGASLCNEKPKRAVVLPAVHEGLIKMLLDIKRIKGLMIESTSHR